MTNINTVKDEEDAKGSYIDNPIPAKRNTTQTTIPDEQVDQGIQTQEQIDDAHDQDFS